MASTWGHIVTKVQTRVEIVLSAFLPPMSLMELHTSVSHGTAHVRKRVDPELLCISGQPPPPPSSPPHPNASPGVAQRNAAPSPRSGGYLCSGGLGAKHPAPLRTHPVCPPSCGRMRRGKEGARSPVTRWRSPSVSRPH